MSTLPINNLKGGILGLALGDALGGPHEFRYSVPLSEYTGKLEYPIKWKARFGPIQHTVIGEVTDDTSMSGALLHSIVENGDWVEDKVISAYLEWANSEAWSEQEQKMVSLKFLGRNTRSLFKGIKTIKGYRTRYQKADLSDNQSNGSLMRAYPLIFLFYYLDEQGEEGKESESQIYQKILSDTKLTNPNIINQDATLIYISAIQMILSGITAQDGVPELLASAQTEPIREAIQQASEGEYRDVTVDKGWVVHPIYLSVQGWIQAETGATFSEIIDWVIMKGGDTDTNGAIVGALIGTFFGETELINEDITNENIQILLSADYSQGELPINQKYHPQTLLGLF